MNAKQIIKQVEIARDNSKIGFVLASDIINCITDLEKSNNENYSQATYYGDVLVDLGYMR